MKTIKKDVTIRELVNGYKDSGDEGIFAYDGKLNVRPSYQREYVYEPKRRDAVIATVKRGLPINTIYWSENSDGTYELLDGQQRTISICQYVTGKFSENFQYFHNLSQEEKDQILDYELIVFVCTGNEKEKLEWFRTINIANVTMSEQELRNATYTGTWLSDAKQKFSKSNCPAYNLAVNYINGVTIRQDFLETALKWISKNNIEQYMADHQNDLNANALWAYFRSVIDWVATTFIAYRKEMKGIDWGPLYDKYKDEQYDVNDLETKVQALLADDDVTKVRGIWPYLLTGEERHLSIRAFSARDKRKAFEDQKGVCPKCSKIFKIDEMACDHIKPWSKGGHTVADNLQLLCEACNRVKSDV